MYAVAEPKRGSSVYTSVTVMVTQLNAVDPSETNLETVIWKQTWPMDNGKYSTKVIQKSKKKIPWEKLQIWA
jgi:hypothetical protein